jgi:hypothetical protein
MLQILAYLTHDRQIKLEGQLAEGSVFGNKATKEDMLSQVASLEKCESITHHTIRATTKHIIMSRTFSIATLQLSQ